MSLERREQALDELAAPLGALVHSVNNALAVIATTTYALQLENRLSDADADAILGGIDSARLAFADYEPIVRSRHAPKAPIAGLPMVDIGSSVSALAGRIVTLHWQVLPPPVTDLTRATRRLIAALWTAADELGAVNLTVTTSVNDARVRVSVQAPDGRVWGPVDIGTAS